jgi:hypothetical protein
MPLAPGGIPEACEGFVLAHWNRNYLCYCFHRGNGDPLQQVVHDAREWPETPLSGFLVWYASQWAAYMDAFEPQWRGWEQSYRQHYRKLHEQAFGLWLWDMYAQSHVGDDGQLSTTEEKHG